MPTSVYLKILAATFLWGTAFPTAKYALTTYRIPPLAFAGMRFTLAGALLLAIGLLLPSKDSDASPGTKTSIDLPRILLIGLLSTCIFYGMFFAGLARTSATSASVLDGAGPIIGSIMAHFVLHNDRLTARKIIAFLVAFAGVATITLGRPEAGAGPSTVSMSGCLLILGGLTVGSLGTMLVITYRGSLSLLKMTGYQMTFGGTLLLLLSLLFEKDWAWMQSLDSTFYAIWFWLAAVSATAFRLWYSLVRKYKVTTISVFIFLNCVWGATLSLVFLKEELPMQLIAGAILVAAGVLIMHWGRQSHERGVPPEAAPLGTE